METANEPRLTIGIPTYNRRECLLRLLRALADQEGSDRIRVLVNDNHSDYDVAEAVSEAGLPADFLGRVNVRRREHNVGGDLNIALTLLDCQTEWMWLFGDDDEPTAGALKVVLEDMERHPDVGFVKYGTGPRTTVEVPPDGLHTDLVSFLKSLRGIYFSAMCISTGLYNMRLLAPYADGLLFNPETSQTQFYLPMRALKGGVPVLTNSHAVADWQEGMVVTWRWSNIAPYLLDYLYSSSLSFSAAERRAYRRTLASSVQLLYRALAPLEDAGLRRATMARMLVDYGLCVNTLVSAAMTLCPPLFTLYNWWYNRRHPQTASKNG